MMSVRDVYNRQRQSTITRIHRTNMATVSNDDRISLSKMWAYEAPWMNEAPLIIHDAYREQRQPNEEPSRHAIGMIAGEPIYPNNYDNADRALFYDENGSAYQMRERSSFGQIRQRGRIGLRSNIE